MVLTQAQDSKHSSLLRFYLQISRLICRSSLPLNQIQIQHPAFQPLSPTRVDVKSMIWQSSCNIHIYLWKCHVVTVIKRECQMSLGHKDPTSALGREKNEKEEVKSHLDTMSVVLPSKVSWAVFWIPLPTCYCTQTPFFFPTQQLWLMMTASPYGTTHSAPSNSIKLILIVFSLHLSHSQVQHHQEHPSIHQLHPLKTLL